MQPTSYSTFIEANRARYEQELFELLRIPSVSADSAYRADVRRAADWMVARFQRMGLAVELIKTGGNPIVFAQSPPVAGAPTVLVYGHYDVQPPDPLGEWHSPPFEPTVRDGAVVARGATDDKGQMLTHVNAADAWLGAAGRLPVQLKFLIEGEEEVGSESLDHVLGARAKDLACDVVVISDTSQFGPGQPAITYGLRGIAYFELLVTGPKQDLHSGTFGGAVVNPANVLCELLAGLADSDRRVRVPGFYDDVIPLDASERSQLAALPFDEEEFKLRIGVKGLRGEAGYTTLERRGARPTYDINGLWSGYQGEGAKTILPARAGAKFSFRLVPRQDPKKIAVALEAYLRERAPAGVTLELIAHSGAPGVLTPLDSKYVAAARRAIAHAFGRAPLMIREGGSIPVVGAFHEVLGADTLLLGWGQDDDNTHGPNEKFRLADFHRGIQASARLWDELSRLDF